MWICATRCCGHVVEIVVGIEIVVLRRDVDVVHVEQDSAVRALDDFAEEFPLGHLRGVKLRVAADVFDAHRHFEEILHLANLLRAVTRGFPNVYGIGSKVVRVAAVDAAPAEMIGEPRRLGALDRGA